MDAQPGVVDKQRREPADDVYEGHVAVVAASVRQQSVGSDTAVASSSIQQPPQHFPVVRVASRVPRPLAVVRRQSRPVAVGRNGLVHSASSSPHRRRPRTDARRPHGRAGRPVRREPPTGADRLGPKFGSRLADGGYEAAAAGVSLLATTHDPQSYQRKVLVHRR